MIEVTKTTPNAKDERKDAIAHPWRCADSYCWLFKKSMMRLVISWTKAKTPITTAKGMLVKLVMSAGKGLGKGSGMGAGLL